MPTERPILFNGDMVRAIIDGSKTQTRRPIKPQPSVPYPYYDTTIAHHPVEFERDGQLWTPSSGGDTGGLPYRGTPIKCPFGVVGDRLWVREAWARCQSVSPLGHVSDGFASYRADGHDTIDDLRSHIISESDGEVTVVEIEDDRWIPSIHMPRWASRITLEVIGVRVERVARISGPGARAEGINVDDVNCCDGLCFGGPGCPGAETAAVDRFEELWDSIYAKQGLGWEVSPWVWAVNFKVVRP